MGIAVIIPAYNAERTIGAAVQSALLQSHPIDEVIVVDDGSIDNTANIVGGMQNSVRLIQQKNLGPSAARNAGLRAAKSEFVAFLDSDDFWLPHKIAAQMSMFDYEERVAAVTCSFEVRTKALSGEKSRIVLLRNELISNLLPIEFAVMPRMPPSTVVVNRRVIGDLQFPEEIREGEDLVFFGLVRTHGLICCADVVGSVRVIHDSQVTAQPGSFRRDLISRRRWIIDNYSKLGIATSVDAENRFWDAARKHVWNPYWARDFKSYRRIRKEFLEACPNDCLAAAGLPAPILPEWVYRLKDAFDRIFDRGR